MTTRLLVTVAALLSAAVLLGCAVSRYDTSKEKADSSVYRGPTPPKYPVRVGIVDAETGETIVLERLVVRFFLDGEPLFGKYYGQRIDMKIPAREVRIVVDDPQKRYFHHEESFRVPMARPEHIVRLRPTHRVLLKGRAIDARTEGPARLGKTRVSLYADDADADDGAGGVSVNPDVQGRFQVYVPRSVLRFGYVNPEVLAVDPTIDLSGVAGDVVERTVLFSPAFE